MKSSAHWITIALALFSQYGATTVTASEHTSPIWLVNNPTNFHVAGKLSGKMIDVRGDAAAMANVTDFCDKKLQITDGSTDGEVVDALEHFFWGMRGGMSIELGALDGSPGGHSQSFDFEKEFGWKRILIEGNPQYHSSLRENSPLAFCVCAAICQRKTIVHYRDSGVTSGILEFMNPPFLQTCHTDIYDFGKPPGNVSSIDFKVNFNSSVQEVQCLPLATILHRIHQAAPQPLHVNFFILDVEGGEFEVLQSINWSRTTFDVLVIETEARFRPPGYAQTITRYLADKGYKNVTEQQGRNTWFTRIDFVPSSRPGIDPQCYNGVRKAAHGDAKDFQPCKLTLK